MPKLNRNSHRLRDFALYIVIAMAVAVFAILLGVHSAKTRQRPDFAFKWAGVAFWAAMTYFLWSSAKREERRRRKQGQRHTKRDTAVLGLSGLILAALILGGVFLKPLNLPYSKALFELIILALGAGLVYLFNLTDVTPS